MNLSVLNPYFNFFNSRKLHVKERIQVLSQKHPLPYIVLFLSFPVLLTDALILLPLGSALLLSSCY